MSPYQPRRTRLMAQLASGLVVIPTAPQVARNADSHYSYRFDSSFYYLTGFNEPEAVLVLDASLGRSLLFCREKKPEREIWEGRCIGPDAVCERYGFDEAYAIEELAERLPTLLKGQQTLWYGLGRNAAFEHEIQRALNRARSSARDAVSFPTLLADVQPYIDEMRLFKDEQEIVLMRRACAISCAAHRQALRVTCPGRHEYEIEAELLYQFGLHGARTPAYESIVAGGANACVLHYVENSALLRDGELLLIDAGCEYQGYASDVTRTFPINGRFSGPQRDVYQVVLAAQHAALAELKPGMPWNAADHAALTVLVQGLIDLGLLHGSLDANLEQKHYRTFYMHRVGHWLGLDVHDVGVYNIDDAPRTLQPGMVTTVEPGLYIRPGPNVPEAFANIGIRIEDDVLITEQGHEVLSHDMPTDIDALEALYTS